MGEKRQSSTLCRFDQTVLLGSWLSWENIRSCHCWPLLSKMLVHSTWSKSFTYRRALAMAADLLQKRVLPPHSVELLLCTINERQFFFTMPVAALPAEWIVSLLSLILYCTGKLLIQLHTSLSFNSQYLVCVVLCLPKNKPGSSEGPSFYRG